MTTTKTKTLASDRKREQSAMRTSPIVSRAAWEAAREQMLVKEKALMRARDGLSAERRRMPWMAVEKTYEFDGPKGKVSLLDLFEGRRQLIITPLGRQETWEDSPPGYPQTPPYKWWNWHDNYDAESAPNPKWVEVSDAGEAAFRNVGGRAEA